MRALESIIFYLAAFAVLWPVVFGVRPRKGIVPGVLVGALVAHLLVEGPRWQMTLLYLGAVGLSVGDILFVDRELKWGRRVSRAFFGVVGLGLAVALPLALPVPVLPTPSGPEPIGTIEVMITDRDRRETYGPTPGGPRRFVAQVWYPADATPDETVPWNDDWDVVAPAMSRTLGLPSWFLNHTRFTKSHAGDAIPIESGSFPVVIYSHGWTGFRSIAINQVEHLVSNGYIVIAPDHTFGAVATRLGDDDVIYADPAALPEREEVGAQVYDEAATALVDTFSGDIISILDGLFEGDDGPFASIAASVDLNKVGIYGHSTGGGAAIKTCLIDERCHAVLGLDAWVEPLTQRDLQETIDVPALYMRSDGWRGTPNDALLQGIAARGSSISYVLGVEGAAHNDFVATPFLSPVAARLGLKGPISSGRVVTIIDNYLLGFFDTYLLSTGSAALDTVSFSEVTLQIVGS